MPPRKKAKATTGTAAASSTRQTRSSATNDVAATAPAPAPAPAPAVSTSSSKKTSNKGQKAQTVTPAASVSSNKTTPSTEGTTNKRKRPSEGLDEFELMELSERAEPRKKPSTKTKTKAAPKKKGSTKKAANAHFDLDRCEEWFNEFKDKEAGEVWTAGSLLSLCEDLGIAWEGVTGWILIWKCDATEVMTIKKEEFMKGMSHLEIDSKEKLLSKLPMLIAEVTPKKDTPLQETPFYALYKFCFLHFRQLPSKNIELETAIELFKVLLNEEVYSVEWKAPGEEGNACDVGPPKPTSGIFPHTNAFIKFLQSEMNSTAVITRDQYDQFALFNKDVPFDLEGFDENNSTWPSLFDTYIAWRREFQPPKDLVEA